MYLLISIEVTRGVAANREGIFHYLKVCQLQNDVSIVLLKNGVQRF